MNSNRRFPIVPVRDRAMPQLPETTQGSQGNADDARMADQNSATPESVQSSQIFRGAQEIRILHGDDTYRLRITRNGKLILTK